MLTLTGPSTSCLTRMLATTPLTVRGRLMAGSPSEKEAPVSFSMSGVSFMAIIFPPWSTSMVERICPRSSKLDRAFCS